MIYTVKQIEALGPGKHYLQFNGLYIQVYPSGRRTWKMKYRFAGKEKSLTLGTMGTTSLKQAREAVVDAKRLLEQGIDPAAEKQERKKSQATAVRELSFHEAAKRWWVTHEPTLASATATKKWRTYELHLKPSLGKMRLSEITPQVLLPVLRAIHAHSPDLAVTCSSVVRQTFQWAVLEGLAQDNPSLHLHGVLPKPKTDGFPALVEPKQVGGLMRAVLYGRELSFVPWAATEVLARLGSRPGEVRMMRWADIDFENSTWRNEVTKTGIQLTVPLPTQVLSILREIKPLSGTSEFVFTGRTRGRAISDGTVNAFLRRLGVTDHVAHGFRKTFSTLLHGAGERSDLIEFSLAHSLGGTVHRTYNQAQYLPERRELLQRYSDLLDKLRDANIE